MDWSFQSTSFEFPVFIIWKIIIQNDRSKWKRCVVVNICGLNSISQPDSYLLSLQMNIISAVQDSHYISTVNCISFFYQWLINSADKFKFTVIFHWEQEHFNVAVMDYWNSPPYIQRQMNWILCVFCAFAQGYVNDIIIFFQILNDHIDHLHQVFELFQNLDISLESMKFYIEYSMIMLLRQCVDALDLITVKKKIKVITNLQFPTTLKALKAYLSLTGWLWFYILYYAQIVASLQAQKTALLKTLSTSKNNAQKQHACHINIDAPTSEKLHFFHILQKLFAEPTFLCHFDSECCLYIDVDAFKQYGFSAVIYHVDGNPDDTEFSCHSIQSIMFLNKLLMSAEQNYWLTEMETAELVWIVWKMCHLIEFSSKKLIIIIITDHNVTTFIARQMHLTTMINTDKLNLQLICVSQYLSQFSLDIQHCSDKIHFISDVLSRLLDSMEEEKENNIDMLNDLSIEAYHIILVELVDKFKQWVQNAYKEDPAWKWILDMIKLSN